ncbi:MAG: BatD family protein [Candidatus Eisenbacteria bacterium]
MRPALLPFLAVLVAGALLGADPAAAVELTARIDRDQVDLDGRVTLTLSIQGGRGEADIDLGETAGFRVYSAGTSQSVSIVNGAVTSSITHTYLLSPRSEGEHSVGPFRVVIGGEEGTAPAVRIRVARGAPAPAPAPPPRGGTGDDAAAAAFLRTFVDKDEAFIGEQVTLTFRLYQRVRFAGDPEYSPPSSEGFWAEDLPPQRRFYDEVRGTNYLVNEVKTALFPTRPGRLVIGPATLRYQEDTFFSSDPFDLLRGGLRGGRRRPVQETLRTDSLAVTVKPLPAGGRPAGFEGAVGSFRLRAELDKDSVAANEPVTLTVTLEGEGNVQAARLPDPAAPETFKVYDSGSATETSKEDYRVRGKKTYTRVFVPRYGGDYTIAPIAFTFFDPDAGGYVTRTAGPFPVRVSGEPPEVEAAQREIERREEDLRYLKEPAGLEWAPRKGVPVPGLLAANAAPLVLLAGLIAWRKHRERLHRDRAWARARRAGGVAKRALAAARAHLGDDDSREFAAALGRGVTGYLGDRTNLPVSGMTAREVVASIERLGGDQDSAEAASRFLAACDRARYAPEPMPVPERERLLAEGEELVRRISRLRREGGRGR